MPDVGKQTKSVKKMKCPECGSINTIFRLPRDTSKKDSSFACMACNFYLTLP